MEERKIQIRRITEKENTKINHNLNLNIDNKIDPCCQQPSTNHSVTWIQYINHPRSYI